MRISPLASSTSRRQARSLALISALAAACLGLAAPPLARADWSVEGQTVQFAQPRFDAGEADGYATITVTRSQSASQATVRYGTTPGTARKGLDYDQTSGRLEFAEGEDSLTFRVRLRDDASTEGSETVRLSLYGVQRASLGDPSTATLVIHDNDSVDASRASLNPLGLSPSPGSDPLAGARFFVDRRWSLAARQERAWRHRHPGWAALMARISRYPEVKRFGSFDRDIRRTVKEYLERVAATGHGAVPAISTYRFLHKRCGHYDGGGAADARRYRRWIDAFAAGIGNHRVVLFHEIDATITAHCLSGPALGRRAALMRYAVRKLAALPHTVVYIDAGAADGPFSARGVAHLLGRYGIRWAQGFFLNATHYNWTSSEVRFGARVSRMVGGKHFVVNTAANGRGPLRPHSRVRYGNTLRCNPPGRGLGTPPTTDTGHALVDAYLWIGNPGRSTGRCGRGDPATGVWFPRYALMLARHASFG